MERQGDKASPRASSRPRFIAEAQPQHHPGTGQTERESHPHADQSPAQHKTAKISYGQRYNKIRNKCNNHHRLYIRYATALSFKTTSIILVILRKTIIFAHSDAGSTASGVSFYRS